MEHLISVTDASVGEAYNNATMDEVIDEFAKDSPNELELVATTLYVYKQIEDVSKVKSGVIKIKGNKYSEKRIDAAIDRLIKTGYISLSNQV